MILDLFAGPGGWSEGIRALGLRDVGLEWDAAACATRAAAGHTTIRCDVAQFPTAQLARLVKGLIASPPCTLFSSAGKGTGRRVMDILADGIRRLFRGEDCRQAVREAICPVALAEQQAANAARNPGKRWSEEKVQAAARTDAYSAALVLEPARYIAGILAAGGTLEWVALEQVPSVLPLWKVYVQELRKLGWKVWAGILNAADYGVPQTRKRAVLAASRVASIAPPEPTHAEDAQEETLFGPGLPKWVSMAESLGWGVTDRPVPTVTAGGGNTGGAEPFPTRAREILLDAQARGAWVLHTNRDQRPDGSRQTSDPYSCPAPSLTAKSGGQWVLRTGNNTMKHSRTGSRRGDGGVVAYERSVTEPAPTVDTGAGRKWTLQRPATTVCATDRIAPPGHRDRSPGGESQFASPDTVRITVQEAALLQSFPADYPWQGTKTKQFEQIGNAVPPLLAAHVVAAAAGLKAPARIAGEAA